MDVLIARVGMMPELAVAVRAVTPWLLYIVGAILALLLNWLKVPALPFSLGMFIPLQLNAPLLVGAIVSWFVGTRSKNEEVNNARKERGTLLASGFIAGGALMGVVSAALVFLSQKFKFNLAMPLKEPYGDILAIAYALPASAAAR